MFPAALIGFSATTWQSMLSWTLVGETRMCSFRQKEKGRRDFIGALFYDHVPCLVFILAACTLLGFAEAMAEAAGEQARSCRSIRALTWRENSTSPLSIQKEGILHHVLKTSLQCFGFWPFKLFLVTALQIWVFHKETSVFHFPCPCGVMFKDAK